jgi:predicted RNA-binding Zn ribbon-like protein
MPAGSTVATMKLVGGDPCLDFVNTVGGRVPAAGAAPARVRDDKLRSYHDLVAFGLHAGLLDVLNGRRLLRRARTRPREATAALRRARAFREALYRTLQALALGREPAPGDLASINTEIAATRAREVLAGGREGLRWEWRGTERLESPLWPVVRAAAALLPSAGRVKVGQCGGEDCGWLFLDRSRNRRRQWCTMEDCGNLAKVRRFRERQAAR